MIILFFCWFLQNIFFFHTIFNYLSNNFLLIVSDAFSNILSTISIFNNSALHISDIASMYTKSFFLPLLRNRIGEIRIIMGIRISLSVNMLGWMMIVSWVFTTIVIFYFDSVSFGYASLIIFLHTWGTWPIMSVIVILRRVVDLILVVIIGDCFYSNSGTGVVAVTVVISSRFAYISLISSVWSNLWWLANVHYNIDIRIIVIINLNVVLRLLSAVRGLRVLTWWWCRCCGLYHNMRWV